MRMPIIAAVTGMAIVAWAGPSLAWDLHDTLAPGPTPLTEDSPPPTEDVPAGADLQLPGADLQLPNLAPDVSIYGGAPSLDSRCQEAIARHGENSAEAWTQC